MQSRFILFIVFISVAGAAGAQELGLPKKQVDAVMNYRHTITDTTGNELRPGLKTIKPNSWLATGSLSHTTPNGKIYIMPFDRMGCLAADMKKVERMPIRPVPHGNMPNAFPKIMPKRERRD
jgi:hypothetical protein